MPRVGDAHEGICISDDILPGTERLACLQLLAEFPNMLSHFCKYIYSFRNLLRGQTWLSAPRCVVGCKVSAGLKAFVDWC